MQKFDERAKDTSKTPLSHEEQTGHPSYLSVCCRWNGGFLRGSSRPPSASTARDACCMRSSWFRRGRVPPWTTRSCGGGGTHAGGDPRPGCRSGRRRSFCSTRWFRVCSKYIRQERTCFDMLQGKKHKLRWSRMLLNWMGKDRCLDEGRCGLRLSSRHVSRKLMKVEGWKSDIGNDLIGRGLEDQQGCSLRKASTSQRGPNGRVRCRLRFQISNPYHLAYW